MNTIAKTTLLAAAVLTTASTAALSRDYGDWLGDCRQGYCESVVTNGPGNEFEISCNEDDTIPPTKDGASVMISIKDESPTKGEVSIVIDGNEFLLFADANGSIDTQCRACADSFIAMQKAILHAKGPKMFVKFPNGDSSSFSLRGVRQAFGYSACWTTYYGPEKPRKGNGGR